MFGVRLSYPRSTLNQVIGAGGVWSLFVRSLLGVVPVVAVQVYKVRLRDGVASLTDGVDIWVDDRLNEVQERCAIEHELEHIARGQGSSQTEPVEMSVRYAVALKLLPRGGAHKASCKGAPSLAAAARACGVTRQVLMDRTAVATEEEIAILGCVECRLCPVIAARYADQPAYA